MAWTQLNLGAPRRAGGPRTLRASAGRHRVFRPDLSPFPLAQVAHLSIPRGALSVGPPEQWVHPPPDPPPPPSAPEPLGFLLQQQPRVARGRGGLGAGSPGVGPGSSQRRFPAAPSTRTRRTRAGAERLSGIWSRSSGRKAPASLSVVSQFVFFLSREARPIRNIKLAHPAFALPRAPRLGPQPLANPTSPRPHGAFLP